jgi:hypothetical protein
MRTFGFRSHLLLAVAAAAGVVASLALPWYAPAPQDKSAAVDPGTLDGHMERMFASVARAVSDGSGTTGWHALGQWGPLIAGVAAFSALMALLCLSDAGQGVARGVLRYAVLANVVLVGWRLFDLPSAKSELELRHGALAAALCALVLASCGLAVAAAPLRRRRPVRTYQAPPPPPAWTPQESRPPS